MSGTIAVALLGVVGVAILWRMFAGERYDAAFTITVSGPGVEGVALKGAVPGHDAADVAEFIASLALDAGAKIWGVPDRGRVTLRFSGVGEGPAQRIRNFVYARY